MTQHKTRGRARRGTLTPPREASRWNERYPVGQPVEYFSYPFAPAKQTHTTTEAFVLGEHTACVFVEGISGCVGLFACKPMKGGA